MKLWHVETLDGKTVLEISARSQKEAAEKAKKQYGIKPHLIKRIKL